jgi:excisionase family DNA binding protein
MEPLALTIDEAARSARRSRSGLYEDIQKGLLRAVKNGRSTRILIDDLRKYLATLPAIEPDAEAANVVSQSGTHGRRRERINAAKAQT